MLIIIAAASENNVIGSKGKIPWVLPEDSKFFEETTKGHVLVMGRKTFETVNNISEMGWKVIVITRQEDYKAENALTVLSSTEAAIDFVNANYTASEEIYICGGAEIYKEMINNADKILLTRIYKNFDGDAYFPNIDEKIWKIEDESELKRDESSQLEYKFISYIKR